MRQLAHGVAPRLSDRALAAADALKYRDFLTVVLILKDRDLFDDMLKQDVIGGLRQLGAGVQRGDRRLCQGLRPDQQRRAEFPRGTGLRSWR